MPASDDFRDGAASGAALMERRLRRLMSWGVRIDYNTVEQLATGIRHEYGGAVQLSDDD